MTPTPELLPTKEEMLDFIDERLKPLLDDEVVGMMQAASHHRKSRAILQTIRDVIARTPTPQPQAMISAEEWLIQIDAAGCRKDTVGGKRVMEVIKRIQQDAVSAQQADVRAAALGDAEKICATVAANIKDFSPEARKGAGKCMADIRALKITPRKQKRMV